MTEREAMTLERQAFEKWVASKPDDWFDEASAEAIAWIAWQTRADLSRTAEPAGYVTQSALDALQSCRRDEVNGTVDVWMRPNESLCATIPIFTRPPEPARDAKDATRYRWLREHDNAYLLAEDVIDEAIAAMAQESGDE